jgi:hypothetical protein
MLGRLGVQNLRQGRLPVWVSRLRVSHSGLYPAG